MDRLMHSVNAFVYPGECEKIEITSEECDMVFKPAPSEESISGKLFRIFLDIGGEHKRQDGKWGKQNHPMLCVPFTIDVMLNAQQVYKRLNETKNYSWFQILMEEVYEAFSEIDLNKQREDMLQVAAVAVRIIECLDRRIEEVGREKGD
jgi:hypothetical protein